VILNTKQILKDEVQGSFAELGVYRGNSAAVLTHYAAKDIRALLRVINRYVGNLPPMPGVFPDYPAPVVRNPGADREIAMMRWGMPPPSRGRPTRHEHPQHLLAALAGMVGA
jgi:hypothetical protein